MRRRRVRFAARAMTLQVGVVVLVLAVGFALVSLLLQHELSDHYGRRALAVARTVAADQDVAAAAGRGDPDGLVARQAERVRAETGALIVVVTDDKGIRLSHPDPDKIGKLVSTDPAAVLAGNEVVMVERGTLGLSTRGKVPLRDAGGRIVGEVSVGFAIEEVWGQWWQVFGVVALFALGVLAVGVLASLLLTRWLKRTTMNLEPDELAELLRDREAVLHGVGEGVLAVTPDGVVSVVNATAARLLGVPAEPGLRVGDLELPAGVRAVLDGAGPAGSALAVAGDRVLVVNRRPVRRADRDLGWVLTLRDRTELEQLTKELGAVRSLTEGLRAQRHEFSNRLHTLSGLLQLGHHREAVEYLQTLQAGVSTELAGLENLADPYLRAFLSAKAAVAGERDVRLVVSGGSWVEGGVADPAAVTTVLGNLVDNAVSAAQRGERRPAVVEVDLLTDGADLHLAVSDSGDGVPAQLRDTLFEAGTTGRDDADRADHGLGLALARQAARGWAGDVWLASPGGAEHGAVFAGRLCGVLVDGQRENADQQPDTEARR